MKKYDTYEPVDSSRIFLKIIIYSFLFSLAVTLIYSIISKQIGMTIEEFSNIKTVALINAFIMEIFFVVFYFIYMQRYSISIVKANNLNKPISWQQIAIVIVLMGFVYVLSAPFCSVYESFLELTGYKLHDINFKLDNPLSIILCVLFLGILPGFVEELIFRGAVLQGLRKYGKWFAIVISALLFMLIHGNIQQTFYQFACGVIFGLLVWETGSIWASITIHCTNNTLGIVLQSLQDCGVISPSAVNTLSFAYILISIVLVVALVFLVILALKLVRKFQLKNVPNFDCISDENSEETENKQSQILGFKQGYQEFKKDNMAYTYWGAGVIIALAVILVNTFFS